MMNMSERQNRSDAKIAELERAFLRMIEMHESQKLAFVESKAGWERLNQ
jgi:hypothetical protein